MESVNMPSIPKKIFFFKEYIQSSFIAGVSNVWPSAVDYVPLSYYIYYNKQINRVK